MLCETGPLSLLANDVVEYQEDNGTGVFMDPAGGSAQVSLTRVQIYRNTVDGLLANGSTAGSIFAGITDNVSNLNGGSGFKAQGGGALVVLDVQRSAGTTMVPVGLPPTVPTPRSSLAIRWLPPIRQDSASSTAVRSGRT